MTRFEKYGAMCIATAVLIICILSVRSCTKPDIVVQPKIEEIKQTAPTHYTDKGGTEHAEKMVAIGEVNALRGSYQHTIDSLSKLLKVKPKMIREIVQAGTETSGDFIPTYILVDDSSNQLGVSYQDKWLKISGVTNSDTSWKYSITDSFTAVTYLKKTGLFRRTLFLDAFAENPNTHIRGLTGIRVERPVKKFGVGLNVSYAYDGLRWRPVMGVGLQYNLIRF